jgi:hypothetical protein
MIYPEKYIFLERLDLYSKYFRYLISIPKYLLDQHATKHLVI